MINFRMAACIALAASLGATGPAHSADQQQSATPSYCSGAGAYRLPECGLTEKQAREAEAAAAAARTPKAQNSNYEAGLQYLSQQAKNICDKPLGNMTMSDIEDCNKPGMRALRSAR